MRWTREGKGQRESGLAKKRRGRRQKERQKANDEKRRKRKRERESENGEGCAAARERMDSASRDVLLTVMSLSSPKVPRRHCINLLLPTPPYWKFYRALHSFCYGRLLYSTTAASHTLSLSLLPLPPSLQPSIPLDEGESSRATLRRASRHPERSVSYPSPYIALRRWRNPTLSVDADASKLQGTMIDNVINHRIGKSPTPTSGSGRVGRPHAHSAHLGDRECLPLEMRASVSR